VNSPSCSEVSALRRSRRDILTKRWHSKTHWELFERWCESNGRTAFPADADTCFDFLRAKWDLGPKLCQTWRAIDERHEAYYWHSSANAVFRMHSFLGLVVRPDGTIEILPGGPEDF